MTDNSYRNKIMVLYVGLIWLAVFLPVIILFFYFGCDDYFQPVCHTSYYRKISVKIIDYEIIPLYGCDWNHYCKKDEIKIREYNPIVVGEFENHKCKMEIGIILENYDEILEILSRDYKNGSSQILVVDPDNICYDDFLKSRIEIGIHLLVGVGIVVIYLNCIFLKEIWEFWLKINKLVPQRFQFFENNIYVTVPMSEIELRDEPNENESSDFEIVHHLEE